ncbi:MAG: 30S ribosomal protein S17e [Candidatus Altiarchaeota archaeon]|nr:30S ribosomal protein S17e [Candidatus Altiarchaeota archaeon]
MGRVKTRNIKKVGEELVRQHPDDFTEDFTNNKERVDKFAIVQSKSLRNKIAGYTVALKRRIVD